MEHRISRCILGRVPLRRRPVASQRRLFSSDSDTTQTRFSYFLPPQNKRDDAQLFAKLQDSEVLANPDNHNAAVVLATPHFSRQLQDTDFVGNLARILSGSADIGYFHILCAVVDDLAAPALAESGALRGISVLRGHLEDTLPELWLPSPPRAKEDADSVSALTFSLGGPSITLPLARTTFQNHRTSTLLTSRFNMAKQPPELAQTREKHSQRIVVSLTWPLQSISGLGLWAPLSPITRARLVTESFGNIIRGVEVEGRTEPASMELEDAVNTLFKHRSASEIAPSPMGIWAMITPRALQTDTKNPPDPTPILQGNPVSWNTIWETTRYLERLYKSGGHLHRIVSGGGGWGPKKGLLSIDPQKSHFAASEEEVMARFLPTMESSDFAPRGSQIQFFIAAQAPPGDTASSISGVAFGVPSCAEATREAEVPKSGYLASGHFGALSSQGIFVAGPVHPAASTVDESKLSVPNSRVYVDSDLQEFLEVSALAGTVAAAIF